MACESAVPLCPATWASKETLAALRRGQGIPAGKKVLIVLDQFEQWLHAKKEEENTDLVQALRQCDGGRVQCIVMVRDDFWMAATRFMRELEIRLLEGQNSAAVDLFDMDHARKVLAAFGRAFGKLPENASETEQGAKGVPEAGRVRLGSGRQGHLRPAGPVCGDDEGQGVDAGLLESRGRHRRASASPSLRRPSVRPPLPRNTAITRKQPEPT